MSRVDWEQSNVQAIFENAGLYPSDEVRSVLDVGCGLSLKSQYVDADTRIGLDIYKPYLDLIDVDVPYIAIQADAMTIGSLFPAKSIDLVLLLDILEHLEKRDAVRLMEMAERIARTAVIVETPRGYVPQNIDIWGHGGHIWQTHRSGWEASELTKRGYEIILRDYCMSDVQRHTELDVDPHIVMMDGIRHGAISLHDGQR